MQISLSKLQGVVTAIIVLGIIGYAGYFLFGVFINGPKPNGSSVVSEASLGIYGPKIQKAASSMVDPSQRVALSKKDLKFMDTDLYKSFTELPVTVLPTKVRGRENPFIPPYVTP